MCTQALNTCTPQSHPPRPLAAHHIEPVVAGEVAPVDLPADHLARTGPETTCPGPAGSALPAGLVAQAVGVHVLPGALLHQLDAAADLGAAAAAIILTHLDDLRVCPNAHGLAFQE